MVATTMRSRRVGASLRGVTGLSATFALASGGTEPRVSWSDLPGGRIGEANLDGSDSNPSFIAGSATFSVDVTSDTPGSVAAQLHLADGTGSTLTTVSVPFAAGTSVVTTSTSVVTTSMTIGARSGRLLGERDYVAQAVATTQSGATGTSQPVQFTTGRGSTPPACKEPSQLNQWQYTRGCGQPAVLISNVTATTADLTWTVSVARTSVEALSAELDYGLTEAYGRTAAASISSTTVTFHVTSRRAVRRRRRLIVARGW